jgi:hypothetical protein
MTFRYHLYMVVLRKPPTFSIPELPDTMKHYHLSEGNLSMVRVVRECGASAKFSGSGGAIVGVCPDDTVFARLEERLGKFGVKVLRPPLV